MATTSKTVVIGSTGYVGSSTVNALSAAGITTVAGVRDPASDKAKPLGELPNVTLAAATMGDAGSIASAIEGASSVLVVTPGHIDRAQLAIDTVVAIKEASAASGTSPTIIVLSVSTTSPTATDTFGKQFQKLEDGVRAASAEAIFLRLPLFIDNNWGQAGGIKDTGKFYGCADPDKTFSTVALADIAACVVAIVQDAGPHAGKTYNLTQVPYSNNQLAAAFSASLSKEVTYVRVPDEGVQATLEGMGFPAWQAAGVVELNGLISADTYRYESDIPALLGRPAMTMEEWVEANKGGFA